MADKSVRVGLVGFGTVGSGVAKLILEDADLIAAKTGLNLQLACVVDIALYGINTFLWLPTMGN